MFRFNTQFILALVQGCYTTNVACEPQVVYCQDRDLTRPPMSEGALNIKEFWKLFIHE